MAVRVVSNYVLWRFIRHRLNNLDQRYPKALQELYKKLFGREELPPRRKFCVTYVKGNLGNAVGALFVQKYFDEDSKQDVSQTDQRSRDLFFGPKYTVNHARISLPGRWRP